MLDEPRADRIRATVEAIYRDESRRILATLIRLLGDFDRAEEALHEAFAVAVERWAADGVPDNPRTWLDLGRALQGDRRAAPPRSLRRALDEIADGLSNQTADPLDDRRRPG